MKYFLKRLSFFSLLIFIIAISLSELRYSDDFIISKTKDTDYEKVGWIISLINENPEVIRNSKVFLGSSYVLNGLNDSILNISGVKAINLAVKHGAEEVNLYFMERILEYSPQEIIFLKSKSGNSGIHKLTPLLYPTSKLKKNGQTINFHLLRHIMKRTKLSLEFIVYQLQRKKNIQSNDSRKYGIRYEESHITKKRFYDINYINSQKKIFENFNIHKSNFLYPNEQKGLSNKLKQFKRNLVYTYYLQNNLFSNVESQQQFLLKAKEICLKEGYTFSQIYLPIVADVVSTQTNNYTYFNSRFSDSENIYAFDDYTFLNQNKFWTDDHHLSKEGSIVFTQKILSLLL